MHRGLIILLLALSVIPVAVAAPIPCFYVAPEGRDKWTGTLPEINEAQTDGPLKNLHHAQKIARRLLETDQQRGVRIYVRQGDYTIKKPLIFTQDDAGLTEGPVQWIAYNNEKPAIHYAGKDAAVQFLDTAQLFFSGFSLSNTKGTGVLIDGCSHIFFAKNIIRNTSWMGIQLYDSNHIRIMGNDIYDVGGVAVEMSSHLLDNKLTYSNQLINNQIYRCGHTNFKTRFNVDIQGDNNRIANNRVFDLPPYSLRVIGSGCEITDNEFFDLKNAMYFSNDGKENSSTIRNNYFHSIQENAIKYSERYNFDAPCSVLIDSNIFHEIKQGAISISEIVGEQSIVNNIFINAFPLLRANLTNTDEKNIDLQHNIISSYPIERGSSHQPYDFTGVQLDGVTIDHNYFDCLVDEYSIRWTNKNRALTQHFSWLSWQAMGFDQNSHVIAPSFIAPDLGDFEVRPDAFIVVENKFTPFPTFRFGIYEDEFRASWPPVESDAP